MALSTTADNKLLFIGDSITDADWRKDPEAVGKGYVRLVRDHLCARYPAAAPRVFNRGISGNKVPDLRKRWQRDVIELAPDVLSIYIGINDVWHGLKPDRDGCSIDDFRAGYRDVLSQTKTSFPAIKLVLCEPSALWLDDPPDANERLTPYVAAVNNLAREFAAEAVVPLHGAFNSARAVRPDIAWTTDGVHPTSTGHMLIARTWLAATGLL
jgi:lysophospholipase L1-like esterase